jgi:UPF0176 protein
MTNNYVVAALYKFAPLQDLKSLQTELQKVCLKSGVQGTLLLAPEGINGTVAGNRAGIDTLMRAINAHPLLKNTEYKESFAAEQPFHRMKIRLKKEIVTIGIPAVNPNKTAGTYLSPEEWNALIADPETIVLDTRNDYEVKIGTFRNAADPHTKTFREFPAYVEKNLHNQKHKKIAMFCTGGIRCEKASSYMKMAGFDEVYHLKGGILKYLETMPAEKSLWEGECFVFDGRVSVGHQLVEGSYILCPSCRHPVSEKDREHEKYIEGVACPACCDSISADRKARSAERHRQVTLSEKRGEKHIGARYGEE